MSHDKNLSFLMVSPYATFSVFPKILFCQQVGSQRKSIGAGCSLIPCRLAEGCHSSRQKWALCCSSVNSHGGKSSWQPVLQSWPSSGTGQWDPPKGGSLPQHQVFLSSPPPAFFFPSFLHFLLSEQAASQSPREITVFCWQHLMLIKAMLHQ